MIKKQVPSPQESPPDPTPEGAQSGSNFDPTTATLGGRILHHRKVQNLTQEALSILTKKLDPPDHRGVSRPVIVGYEKGDTLPGAREIGLLADALDVTPSYLLRGRYDLPRDASEAGQVLIHALERFVRLTNASAPKKIEDLMPGRDPITAIAREKLIKEVREEALAKNQDLHQARTRAKGK